MTAPIIQPIGVVNNPLNNPDATLNAVNPLAFAVIPVPTIALVVLVPIAFITEEPTPLPKVRNSKKYLYLLWIVLNKKVNLDIIVDSHDPIITPRIIIHVLNILCPMPAITPNVI